MQDYSFNEYFDRFPIAMSLGSILPMSLKIWMRHIKQVQYSPNWKNLLQEGDA